MTATVVNPSREGAVAVLELHRPKAKNALNQHVLDALRDALAGLRSDDEVRAIVLTGAGGDFCAGADVTAFEEIRAESAVGDRTALGDRFWAELRHCPKPVLAAVEGLALGGGCELALACDIVIAGESAYFGVPEVKLGVIPGAGGTQRLVRTTGKSTTLAMLLTGDPLQAGRAREAGIVTDVVPDGEARKHAIGMGQRIAANSPLAVALAKDAATQALETSLSQGLEHEKRNFYIAMQSSDSHEGQQAFLTKRSPNFTGR